MSKVSDLIIKGNKQLLENKQLFARQTFNKIKKIVPSNTNELNIIYTHFFECEYKQALKLATELYISDDVSIEIREKICMLKAACYLSLGLFDIGWTLCKWRPNCLKQYDVFKKIYKIPCWDGTPHPNRTLLIMTDEGLGDELFNTTYLHLLEDKVRKAYVQCDKRLIPLFERTYNNDIFIFFPRHDNDAFQRAFSECTHYALASDLVMMLNPTLEKNKTIPLIALPPFLKQQEAYFSKNVGISYYTTNPNCIYRMPPESFWDDVFTQCSEISFINLQENHTIPIKQRVFLYSKCIRCRSAYSRNDG